MSCARGASCVTCRIVRNRTPELIKQNVTSDEGSANDKENYCQKPVPCTVHRSNVGTSASFVGLVRSEISMIHHHYLPPLIINKTFAIHKTLTIIKGPILMMYVTMMKMMYFWLRGVLKAR